MVWFRVDDVLPFHERVIRAGNAAMGLWVRAGAWSSGQLTDGFVPADVARTLGSAKEIRQLLSVGLWHEEERGGQAGYLFHAWEEDGTGMKRQPTRAEVEAQRRAERERKAAWRESRRSDDRTPPPVPAGHPAGHPADETRDSGVRPGGSPGGRPDTPTRPDPSRPSIEDQKPSSLLLAEEEGPGKELALLPAAKPPRGGRKTYPEAFERFWDVYPRRDDKADAAKAWQAALRNASAEEITAGAARYRDDPNRTPAYTKLPGTWLRAGSWENGPLPPRADTQQQKLQSSRGETLAALERMGVA